MWCGACGKYQGEDKCLHLPTCLHVYILLADVKEISYLENQRVVDGIPLFLPQVFSVSIFLFYYAFSCKVLVILYWFCIFVCQAWLNLKIFVSLSCVFLQMFCFDFIQNSNTGSERVTVQRKYCKHKNVINADHVNNNLIRL
jgi:hypothetical protein